MRPPYYQPSPQFSQDLNYCPQPTPYFGSASGGSSSTVPAAYTSSPAPEIQVEASQATTTTTSGGATQVPKKRKANPKYTADWWRYFEQTLDADGHLVSAKCKVKKCSAQYFYKVKDGTNSFKRHAEKHIANKQEPQERPDPTNVQTLINPDGSRTHQRYDEKKC